MADTPFAWEDLAKYKAEGRFLDGYPDDQRTFFAPRDDVHGILVALLGSAQHSIVVNMFGYDDDELNTVIETLVEDQQVYVQGTLDKSQAGGVHEKKILDGWKPSMRASFAVGESATHQISHTKGGVLDGIVAFEGSTNWSSSGEGTGISLAAAKQSPGFKAQNNTLAVYVNTYEIAKFAARLDYEHAVAKAQGQRAAPAQTAAPAGSE